MKTVCKLVKALCVFAATAAMAPVVAVCLPFRCAWEALTESPAATGEEGGAR